MITNCLVSKLKGIVEKDNMDYFGYTSIPVGSFANIRSSYALKFFVEGGDGLVNNLTEGTLNANAGNSITGDTGTVHVERNASKRVNQLSLRVGGDHSSLASRASQIKYPYVDTVSYTGALTDGVINFLASYNGYISFQGNNTTGDASPILQFTNMYGINVANSQMERGNLGSLMPQITMMENLEAFASYNTSQGNAGTSYLQYILNRPNTYSPLILKTWGNYSYVTINGTDADTYLNKIAQCKVAKYQKEINVNSRTHASDDDVNTLISMGYTIKCGSVVEE